MSYAAALVDLDGTVWRGRELVPGADRALATLRERGVPVVFVTNNTGVRPTDFATRLDALGVDPDTGPVVTAGWATAQYLADRHPDASVFVLGQVELVDELREAGLDVLTAAHREGPADVVVAAYDERISFERLTRALRVFGPGTVFVAANPDRSTPEPDGSVPGVGATVGAVEGMTGHDPLVVGKPETRLDEIAAEKLGVPLSACLTVGDNVHTDILMAERAGIDSAFVRTVVSDEADAEASGIRPTHVLDSLADLPALF